MPPPSRPADRKRPRRADPGAGRGLRERSVGEGLSHFELGEPAKLPCAERIGAPAGLISMRSRGPRLELGRGRLTVSSAFGEAAPMLRLASATGPGWAERAAAAIDVVLLDHGHLEKKAASTALTLIFRYPEHPELARPLSELAREELTHFELVLEHLSRRGQRFERLRPSPYAGRLMTAVRAQEPNRLLDTLLCSALIEARSCERMRLLSEALIEPDIVHLYRGLLASEARHHGLYLDLASGLFGRATVEPRLREIAAHEAEVIASNPLEPRLHNR